MRVVFLQDVPRVAQAGDVKEVANGYARNYLIPKGLAVPATPDQLQRVEAIRRAAEQRRQREREELQALMERLQGYTLTVAVRAGEGGRLYGSVTNSHIAEALSSYLGQGVDRRWVDLPEPIKQVGTYQVPVRPGHGLEAQVTVVVSAEGVEAPAPAGEATPAEGAPEGPAPEQGGEGEKG